jgi:two-component system phosphate regulon response regulator OmpR
MSSTGRLLIVEDDTSVREMLAEYLGTHGYEVAGVDRGTAMREAIENNLPDVVLLDVNLPGEDGLSLARFLRERFDVGIIMVTGATGVADRVAGLEVGADDYVTKPFDMRELLARVKSVVRRMQALPQQPSLLRMPGSLARPRGPLHDRPRVASAVRGRRQRGAADEHGIRPAQDLHCSSNQVLSRERLLTLTRNREWEPFDRSIDIRIARVRRKVESDPERPQTIRTVRGEGYLFVPAPAAV